MTVTAYQLVYPLDLTTKFTFDQAQAFLSERGLQLASIDDTAEDNFVYNIIGSFFGFESGVWITHSPGFTAWAPSYPLGNGQPYLNDAEGNRGWRNDLHQVSSALVELDLTKFISHDGEYNAVFSVTPGLVLEGRGSTDVFVGTEGAEILKGGGGSDALYGGPSALTGGGGADVFYDGDGADGVMGSAQSTLKAALDGDDDFYQVGKVDYSAATEDIEVYVVQDTYQTIAHNEKSGQYGSEEPVVARNEIGRDDLSGTAGLLHGSIYTGSGNDSIGWTGRLANGGAGNDEIYGGWTDFLVAEGGRGDDDIHLFGHGGRAIGGSGGDWIEAISDGLGLAHEMTGGQGADTFVFRSFWATSERQIIWDLNASGAEQDRLYIEDMLHGAPNNVQEALDQGYMRIRHQGGYTYLDFDDSGGADQFDATLTLKGVFGVELYDNIVFS